MQSKKADLILHPRPCERGLLLPNLLQEPLGLFLCPLPHLIHTEMLITDKGILLHCALCILLWIRTLPPCTNSLKILCIGSIKRAKGQAAKSNYFSIKNSPAFILTCKTVTYHSRKTENLPVIPTEIMPSTSRPTGDITYSDFSFRHSPITCLEK